MVRRRVAVGSLCARYLWQDAAQAHRVVEHGHTRGKIVLIVGEDLAAALEVWPRFGVVI